MVSKRKWTDEEKKFLIDNHRKLDLEVLAKKLNRTENSVRCRAGRMGIIGISRVRSKRRGKGENANARWNEREIIYLKEKWGKYDLNIIANRLNRTKPGVRMKILELGLGNYKDNSFSFSFGELSTAFSRSPKSSAYKWHYEKWSKAGLKIEDKQINGGSMRLVSKAHFWSFAEEHKDLFEWEYLDRFALGEEPSWVEEERLKVKKDKKYPKQGRAWSKRDSNLLVSKVKSNRFTYEELAQEFGRTPAGIRGRLFKLGIKNRPLTRRYEE